MLMMMKQRDVLSRSFKCPMNADGCLFAGSEMHSGISCHRSPLCKRLGPQQLSLYAKKNAAATKGDILSIFAARLDTVKNRCRCVCLCRSERGECLIQQSSLFLHHFSTMPHTAEATSLRSIISHRKRVQIARFFVTRAHRETGHNKEAPNYLSVLSYSSN